MGELLRNRWLLVFLLVFWQSGLNAQSDTVNLKEIRVSSAANPVGMKKIPRQIGVVLQKEIRNVPANSLGAILEQVAGVDVRQRGVFGMQADMNLNGGSFDQTLLLINGIPVNDPQTGHHNLDQVISLSDIKKIEIVRGAASRWFGPNAFAGAINIITTHNSGNSLSFDLQAGQYGLLSSSFLAAYHTGKISQQTSVDGGRSDGYRFNTDFKNIGFSHQVFLRMRQTKINLQLGYRGKAFGANSFYTAKYPDQFEEVKLLSAGMGIRGGARLQFGGNIYWRRLYDRFELFREGNGWYRKQGDWYVKGTDSAGFRTPTGFYPYRGPNFHRTDIAGAQGNITLPWILGKTTVGMSWQYDKILSNVLGVPLGDTLFSALDHGAWYDHQKSRNRLNLFINHLYQKQNFSLSAGINLFYGADYGFFFSPGLDISWFVTGNLKTYFSVNRAIRLPTFTDLYYQGPDHISNPLLKPEKVYGFSTGMQYFMKKVSFSVSCSYRMGYDIIDWVKQDAGAKWESLNLTRMNTFGTGFSLDYRPGKKERHFVKYLRVNYRYLHSEKISSGYVSLYALDYLRHHFTLYLEHHIARNLSAGWTFAVEKRNGYYFDYENQSRRRYPVVFLMNTKVKYRIPHFVFYVQANNLLNRSYRDIGSVVMPGIWVTAGLQYHISLNGKR